VETPRQWSGRAIAQTTPVLLALFAIVTMLALRLRSPRQIPMPVTAWYRKVEPTFVDCLALMRRHLWYARYLVNSTAKAECVQLPCEAVDLLITGFPSAA
jgi:hypothetical protein